MGLLFLTLAASVVASACGLSRPAKTWPVVVHHAGKAHTLQVPEDTTVLAAVEIAGLLPGSECRRGRCLSCAARVVAGEPFSLRVASDTALCEAAHTQGLVLLCSAFPLRVGRGWSSSSASRVRRGTSSTGSGGRATLCCRRLPRVSRRAITACRRTSPPFSRGAATPRVRRRRRLQPSSSRILSKP